VISDNSPGVAQEVGTKTMQGASLMVLRTLVLYPIGFIGEVSLARLLAPSDFGVYAIASFITVTLAGAMEVGLAAALIQRQTEASDQEYQTLFTLQLLGISILVLLVFLTAPWLFPLLNFDVSIRWTLLALLISPWVSSFGTVSVVKLERALRYSVFAKIDVMRGITYVGLAVGLAYWGARSWSFVVAIICSTLVKSWVAFREAPWPIRFRLSLSGMSRTLRFGVIFQLSTLTSLFRDHIGVVLGGPLFGPVSVGYLNWAKNITYYTSQIFTQVVSRVAFPSIARVQDDREVVGQMTQTILKYVNLFTFPVILILASLIPEFVSVVFTDKWRPAIPAFYFYSLRMLGSNVTTLFINVFYGLGRLKTSLRILVYWTLLDWLLSLLLCPFWGFTGIAMAYGFSVLPICVWLILELNRITRINLNKSLYLPLLLSGAACVPILILKSWLIPSWVTVFILTGTGFSTFVLMLVAVERKTLLTEGRIFLLSVFRR
jgi:O-antigen/teichoic acid export membrane protein